jgi:hypothetical protein
MSDVTKFLLEINFGDDTVQDGGDIAGLLREVADLIEDEGPFEEPLLLDTILSRAILNTNGTACGRWAVKSLSAEQATRQIGW